MLTVLSGTHNCKMTTLTCSKFIFHALVCACILPQTSCHFFSMKFFRQLIPSKRVSNITVWKTEAISVTGCNLECINKKPCISTLFTISKNKCVLLKSIFKDIKDFGQTTENGKSVKVIESRSQNPCSLVPCNEEKVTKSRSEPIVNLEDYNCKNLKQKNKTLTSGYYDVWLDSSKKSKIKVFCDMNVDGGGWTQILSVKSNTSNINQFLTRSFTRWTNLTGFSPSGNYMIEPSALKNSTLVGGKTQMRFHCSLPNSSPTKTLHLMTTNDSLGTAVVNYLLGNFDTQPAACNSYKRLAGDISYLSQHCSDWRSKQATWGAPYSTAKKNRFLYHLIWIHGLGHWNLFENWGGSNRFECDNERIGHIGKGDFWQIFVR